MCSYVRKLLMYKRDRSLCSGKGSSEHSKKGRCSGTAFYSMAEGNKEMSDVNVKRRLHKDV